MTPPENDHGTTADTSEPHVTATPAQLLEGLRVGLPSLTAYCSRCDAALGSGDTVSVYAYRPAETPRWGIARLCCDACAPTSIATPTLGTAEVRATAELGIASTHSTQQHSLCLVAPSIVAVVPPETGTPP